MLGYVGNVMVRILKIVYNKMYCKHFTLNRVIHIVQGSDLRPPALPSCILFIGFSFKKSLCIINVVH
jgi:hypothetical protein